MEDHKKTKAELIDELVQAREQIAGITQNHEPHLVRESNAPYGLTIDANSREGIAVTRDGLLLYVSKRFVEIFGYDSAGEVLGKPASVVVHPVDRERVGDYTGVHGHGANRPSMHDFLGARKDGTPVPVQVYVLSACSAEESISLVHVKDITRQKQVLETLETRLKAAEQAQEESEKRFMSLAGQSTIGVFLLQDNVFRYVNGRLAAIFGYGTAEMIGKKGIEDLASPEDRAVLSESLRKRQPDDGQPLHFEFTGLRKDGATVCVEIHGSPVKYMGRPAVVGTLIDESDRKKLEAQLIQSEKMKAIGTLAGGIAHDFNNILMAIQGYTSLMLHHLESSHPHFTKLKGIEELVESGSDLTKQLLSFESGGTYEIRPADLNEIVKKTSTMFARTRKEITIQSRYETDPCVIDVDSGQIEQMLLNLYVNAWQAMPDGGSLVLATENVTLDRKFVRPYSLKPGKYGRITVTDSGVGMDEKTKERIFEPFFTTKKRSMGTGLGLSSVYNIVKGHNGIITVTSEKGQGSTFCIYLPLSKRTVEKVEPASRAVLKGAERVLLVDDEETVVSVSKDMLEALGYSVLIARSGQEALRIFQKEHNRIDLVILDVIMPDMGGAETFDEIQKIDPAARVVLSSGYSLDGLATKIMDRGCKAFIQKPFTINLLSQKLRDVLERG